MKGLFTCFDASRQYTEPTRKYAGDAGYDLYSPVDALLSPFHVQHVKTNVRMHLPPGWFALMQERSSQGLAGVFTLGNVGDEGYEGEIGVSLLNVTRETKIVHAGDRIAQLVLIPRFIDPEEHLLPSRGGKGFGSSGR